MDILQQIRANLPFLHVDMAEDVIQDIAMLVLEGEIDADNMASGIKLHLPELKRRYPSAQFQLSLDQPISDEEGSGTLGDIIYKAGVLPKRRGDQKKRKNSRPMTSAICKWCEERFYFKKPGRKLKKKELARVRMLEEGIDPRFWTKLDITLLRVANPDLINKHRHIIGRTAHVGNFCSQSCSQKFACTQPKKLPPIKQLNKAVELLGAKEVARTYSCTVGAINRALVNAGLRERKWTRGETCIEPGCTEPRHRILHRKNGTWYGTRCRQHRSQHMAAHSRKSYRAKNNVDSSQFRVDDEDRCIEEGCTRKRDRSTKQNRRRCEFHRKLMNAERERRAYRDKNGIGPERWRVDAQ